MCYFPLRAEVKPGAAKSKPKAISKLSHDLFSSGSYDEGADSGDLFSPEESSKPLPTLAAKTTATPTTSTSTAPSTSKKPEKKAPSLLEGEQKRLWRGCGQGVWSYGVVVVCFRG